MHCASCGTLNPAGATYCNRCGRAADAKGGNWGAGTMTFVIIATILFPIIGVAVGIVGMTREATRSQGLALLAFGLCAWAMSAMILMSMFGG